MGILGRKKKNRVESIEEQADHYRQMQNQNIATRPSTASSRGYQYALEEYNNTVESGSGDAIDMDVKRSALTSGSARGDTNSLESDSTTEVKNKVGTGRTNPNINRLPYAIAATVAKIDPAPRQQAKVRQQHHQQHQQQKISSHVQQKIQSSKVASSSTDDYETASEPSLPNTPLSSYSFPNYPGSPNLHKRNNAQANEKGSVPDQVLSPPEPEMVDTTYSEHYGDHYTGKPIRYIYPQGYGSMRPRSRPWQIALVSSIVFAWLNVFIVGHCSDRFDWEAYEDDQYGYAQQQFDDDAMKIETRWCGSRTLYFMWVFSVVISGLSCAYCSIIGYVKARDFAIANGRSQPPGMMGKSDYYVQIEEELGLEGSRRFDKGASVGLSNVMAANTRGLAGTYSYQADNDGASSNLRKTIYQADGTPRFLGGHIYKPTQAAVSLTSR